MSDGRVYTIEFENVAVTAAQDFFEIAPADDKPVEIMGLDLSQSSDVGDAAEEMLRVRVIRGHATSGSGGSSVTPRPMNPSDTAAGAACEVNNTTIASAGTGVNLWSTAFNIRVGLPLMLPPEFYWECTQAAGAIIVVRLMAGPTDSLSMSGTLTFREKG